MSYAGPARTSGSSFTSRPPSSSTGSGVRPSTSRGAESDSGEGGADWQQLSVFGVGLALGLALGAGVALMTTPRTGAETRAVLRSRAGRLRRTTGRRGRDAWDDLQDELQKATRALRRRKLRRELSRESALD